MNADPPRWVEISVLTSPFAAEAVAAILLEARTGGVVEEIPAPGQVRLRAYLPLGPATPVTIETITRRIRVLPEAGIDLGPGAIDLREMDAENWATSWRAYFKTVHIGRRLVIKPTWERYEPREGEVVVELDPGMAFGSGLHPSTRQCLQVVEAEVRGGEVVFDVGTGSGILSLAAAKLGAVRVEAADIDPIAVEVARRNAAYNAVADRVRVHEGSLLEGFDDRADLILANISGEAAAELLPQVPPRMAPGARVVVAGMTAEGYRLVMRAAQAAGLHGTRLLREEEWRCIAFTASS
ncbi:MAG: 50S ribosomal protein L11 methyltransferase [Armatimonadetes bacterium]|nr:50S ribosomal protein L11 methyltransferase [Armatimonadota bacterium]